MSASYPPDHHVLRDLRLDVETRPGPAVRGRLAVTDQLRTASGTTSAGVLGMVVDVLGGGLAAIAAHPDWIATADLTLHVVPTRAEQLVAHGTVVRQGRTTVVLEVQLVGDGVPFGLATMTFAVLPHRATNPVIAPESDEISRMTLALPTSGFASPFTTAIGITGAIPGSREIAVTDYVRNSLGGLQGGIIAGLVTDAAESALDAALGGPVAAVDLQITYLALARSGPAIATTTVLERDAITGTARVEVRDVGAENQLTTVGRVRALALT